MQSTTRQHSPIAADLRFRNIASRQIGSSLILQQLLYYHVFYSISWIIAWAGWLFHLYWEGLSYSDKDIARSALIVVWLITEPIRLVAGWYGNLQENLPWLLLFVILTVLPGQATVLYMLIAGFKNHPWNEALQVSQIILLEVEVVLGIIAVVRLFRLQKQQYYLFEFAMGQKRAALQYTEAAIAQNRRS